MVNMSIVWDARLDVVQLPLLRKPTHPSHVLKQELPGSSISLSIFIYVYPQNKTFHSNVQTKIRAYFQLNIELKF